MCRVSLLPYNGFPSLPVVLLCHVISSYYPSVFMLQICQAKSSSRSTQSCEYPASTISAPNTFSEFVGNQESGGLKAIPRIDTPDNPAEQRLIQHLLLYYDTDARGVLYTNSTVRVDIELMLLRIQSLDERSQVLTTTGHIICNWRDERLRWVREEFDNLEDVVLKPDRIWLPELALMNGAEVLTPDFSKVRVLVRHDGLVHWEPGGIFTTTCDINVLYFPFDDQSCHIQFGAWAYYSARMNITSASHTIQTRDFRLNGEWDVYESKAEWKENTLPCCPQTRYPYVEFTLYLKRRQAFYVMNIILPCVMLSVLVMVVFCLPPDAGEKISLGISVLLAFTVFLLMVAESIPRTSLHIPMLVIYLTCTMGLGTVSVCLTVQVLNLHHRDDEHPIPEWTRKLVLVHLSRILRVGARKPQTMAENQLIESSERIGLRKQLKKTVAAEGAVMTPALVASAPPRKTFQHSIEERLELSIYDHKHDWKELAHVLDRLYFCIVLTALVALTLMILLVPFYKPAPGTP